jgi:hypothetical protein
MAHILGYVHEFLEYRLIYCEDHVITQESETLFPYRQLVDSPSKAACTVILVRPYGKH